MKIDKIFKTNYIENSYAKKINVSKPAFKSVPSYANYSSENLRANFLSFSGNAPEIKSALIITQDQDDIPLMRTQKNGSFVVDFDSQTEVIYGKDAIRYLNSTDYFKYDTQVIFPKKANGFLEVDNKKIELTENSAVMINANSKAKISVKNGFPMLIISKKDYDWYERYSKDANDGNIRSKFSELVGCNSRLYNGEFSPDILLSDKMRSDEFLNRLQIDKNKEKNNLISAIYSKMHLLSLQEQVEIFDLRVLLSNLMADKILKATQDGYIKADKLFESKYFEKSLIKKGYSQEDIDRLLPVLNAIRQTRIDSKFVIRNDAKEYNQELVAKLKQAKILYDNKKDADKYVYWRECFGDEQALKQRLIEEGFCEQEQKEIIQSWLKTNKLGLDASGLKFINEDLAVYNLNDKLNNWTLEKTNWVTNSTAPASNDGKTAFVGVSLVQTDKNGPIRISELRKGECLHTHPNLKEKRQTEVYMVTSGKAALNVVKEGKTQVRILNEGELAVVGAGVPHCINSVMGEYEHIVAQVPSAFQYGFGFKQNVTPPADYDDEKLTQEAFRIFREID